MTSDRETELESVLIGGLEQRPVVIVEHDPVWALRAMRLCGLIASALGERMISVEHIGSTAVPGLAAKPIIDLLLVVPDIDDEETYLPALEASGLVLRVREPGHRLLRTPELDVHLHVLSPGTVYQRDYRDLRDWLRVDATDRELYSSTKKRLSSRKWIDMNFYADAKSDVIREILVRARSWRQEQSPDA